MKGIACWLRGFGSASLISLVFIEACIVSAQYGLYKKEKTLKEYYRDELDKCKNQESETTE